MIYRIAVLLTFIFLFHGACVGEVLWNISDWETRLKHMGLSDQMNKLGSIDSGDGIETVFYRVWGDKNTGAVISMKVSRDSGEIYSYAYLPTGGAPEDGKPARTLELEEVITSLMPIAHLVINSKEELDKLLLHSTPSPEEEGIEIKIYDLVGTDALLNLSTDAKEGIHLLQVERVKPEKKEFLYDALRSMGRDVPTLAKGAPIELSECKERWQLHPAFPKPLRITYKLNVHVFHLEDIDAGEGKDAVANVVVYEGGKTVRCIILSLVDEETSNDQLDSFTAAPWSIANRMIDVVNPGRSYTSEEQMKESVWKQGGLLDSVKMTGLSLFECLRFGGEQSTLYQLPNFRDFVFREELQLPESKEWAKWALIPLDGGPRFERSKREEQNLRGGDGASEMVSLEADIGKRVGPFVFGMSLEEFSSLIDAPEREFSYLGFIHSFTYSTEGLEFGFTGRRLSSVKFFSGRVHMAPIVSSENKGRFYGDILGMPGGLSLDSSASEVISAMGIPISGTPPSMTFEGNGSHKYDGIEFHALPGGKLRSIEFTAPSEIRKEWLIEAMLENELVAEQSEHLKKLIRIKEVSFGTSPENAEGLLGDLLDCGMTIISKDLNLFDEDDSKHVVTAIVDEEKAADKLAADGYQAFSFFGKSKQDIKSSLGEPPSAGVFLEYLFTDGEEVGHIIFRFENGGDEICDEIQVNWYRGDML